MLFSIIAFLGCADIPDELRDEANGNKSSSSIGGECESIFNPSTHFCYYGGVYPRCNGMEYNPETHVCQGSITNPAKCNGWAYNPLEEDCCVSELFSLADQRCQNNVVETKCGTGNNYHNPATQFCNGNGVFNLCNGWEEYNPANQRCQSDVVETKCGTGNNYHNPATQFCNENGVFNLCNGWEEYNPTNQRCQNDVVETKCGSEWYDARNTYLRCQNDVVETQCGTGWYDVTNANLRCQNNVVETKCGTKWYDELNQRCGTGNVIETQCGTGWYDVTNANLRCQNNVVETKCGANWYNFAIGNCYNGTSGSVTYGNQTYKIVGIGTQMWMAANLNYNVEGSKCYAEGEHGVTADSIAKNCDTYGRLYNWATAMGLPDKCNSTLSTSDTDCTVIKPYHQGICPSGWHLPSDAEWNTLIAFVHSDNGLVPYTYGSSAVAGKYLKSTSGWYNNGNDEYGFAALPGGSLINDNSRFIGSVGQWWSLSEDDASIAYFRHMDDSEYAGSNSVKVNLKSVRCVMD
jgi:uncharacterized protein (TIGR02145 family)